MLQSLIYFFYFKKIKKMSKSPKMGPPPSLGFSECWPSWLLLALFFEIDKIEKKNIFLQKNNLASQQKKLAYFFFI